MSSTINFETDELASGDLTVLWHDRNPRCNGEYQVSWSATKQVPQSAQTSAQETKKPNAFETLLQIFIFGLSNGAVLALNAIGVTLIYSTVRTLNLAHGDVFALTSALVTSLVNIVGITQKWPPMQLALALVFVLCMSMLLGALLSMGVEQLGFKPFRGSSRLAPLIATLGLSFILFQGALVWRTFQGSWIPGEHRSVPGIPEVPTDGIPNLLPEIDLVQALGQAGTGHSLCRVFVILMAIFCIACNVLSENKDGQPSSAVAEPGSRRYSALMPIRRSRFAIVAACRAAAHLRARQAVRRPRRTERVVCFRGIAGASASRWGFAERSSWASPPP
jgi:branched-subunit amino acid ABC-type transport system permease component